MVNMAQATSYMRSRKKRKGPSKGIVLVAALIFLFVGAVIWFRSSKKEPVDQISTVVPSVEPFVVEQPEETMSVGVIDQTVLSDVTGGASTGTATREIEDGLYRHVIKAYLPELEEGFFYEGWLVRPSPFNYFSTGSMVHNESGEWVLEWFGRPGENYTAYSRIVITLEPLDDADPGPADHIL